MWSWQPDRAVKPWSWKLIPQPCCSSKCWCSSVVQLCKPGCPGEQLHDAAAHTWIYGYCQGKEFPPCLRFLSLPIDHRMFLYSPLANILTTHIHCQFKKDNTHKKNCVNTATCSTWSCEHRNCTALAATIIFKPFFSFFLCRNLFSSPGFHVFCLELGDP